MTRHRLAALFEPRTLLVLAQRPLPIAQQVPETLRGRTTLAQVVPGRPIGWPTPLAGLAQGTRLDVALLCLDPARLLEALDALETHRPRILVLLEWYADAPRPAQVFAACRGWAQSHDCLLLGPNAFGVQRPERGLNLSQNPSTALSGKVALVTQSRSIIAATMDWAADIKAGFSTVISLNGQGTITLPMVLDFLAMDPHTDSIALYLDAVSSARQFTSALRSASSTKPVVVLKAGRSGVGIDGISDAVFDALLRRAGAVRIRYFVQLFSALKVLAYARRPQGRKIALLANGTGPARLAQDVIGPDNPVLRAELSGGTRRGLRDLLEPGAASENPVITHAPLQGDRIQRIVELLLADAAVDGIVVLLAPDPSSDMAAVAGRLAAIVSNAHKPVITCFMGDAAMRPLRHVLDSAGAPAFRTPESAANAFGLLASHHYNQVLSQQTLPLEPLARAPLLSAARDLVRDIRNSGRLDLTPAECHQLFGFFHVPIQSAPQSAGQPGGSRREPLLMAIRVGKDARLGPYIKFGMGGQDARISGYERGLDVPPLNNYLARQLVQRSLLWRRVLSRQMTAAALDCLQESLERISDLLCFLPGIERMVIDPLFADGTRLWAPSVRLRLGAASLLVLPETSGYAHMAIHPYPRDLVRTKTFADGQPWMMRPIRPEDAAPLQEFMRNLSDESRYMRFVSMLRELTPRMLARYTRIDYDRELALIATVQVANPSHRGYPRELIIGFAHYLRNADGRGAEYALVIADEWQGRRLGSELMRGLIEAAQRQGLTYIEGVVLASNRPMLGLMTYLGFLNDPDPGDYSMRRVWLDLGEARMQRVESQGA